jgi:hypothetical protein
MPADILEGWQPVEGLPSVDDLTYMCQRHPEKLPSRNVLTRVASEVPNYRHPSSPIINGRIHCGLTFDAGNGKVLLAVPQREDIATEPVRMYTNGEVLIAQTSAIACDFTAKLEARMFA